MKLENKDFDIKEAMHFCANSEEIYREVLLSALQEGEEKVPLLEKCIENEDIERYRIEIHGIKNVAKTIGAKEFGEIVEKQNSAAKLLELEAVKKGHKEFMDAFRMTLDIIDEILKEEM